LAEGTNALRKLVDWASFGNRRALEELDQPDA
jgi:hypothetical protein